MNPLDDDRDRALAELLRRLEAQDYRFITPTPLTHARYRRQQAGQPAADWRGIFGWNQPFDPERLPDDWADLLRRADALLDTDEGWRSAVRVSSLGDDLFLHSAYPTTRADAVFFGPDTYRFARFLREHLQRIGRGRRGLRVLDVGCGSGAGGIVAARTGGSVRLTLNDINPLALRYAAINAAVAEVDAALAEGDAFDACEGEFDVILCNPPYIADDEGRLYRDGGDGLGRALGRRIALQALERLAPGGCLLFYTGVAIVDGGDPLRAELEPALEAGGFVWSYEEIDPDVFGEELERPVYARAERIAVVGLTATRAVGGVDMPAGTPGASPGI